MCPLHAPPPSSPCPAPRPTLTLHAPGAADDAHEVPRPAARPFPRNHWERRDGLVLVQRLGHARTGLGHAQGGRRLGRPHHVVRLEVGALYNVLWQAADVLHAL
jgi:hypothetical protein